jgi:uncharacterized protein involved in exopolysaccharide biosynthesis
VRSEFVALRRVLGRYRWLILGAGLLGAAVAGIAAILMTPVYRAEVVLAPPRGNDGPFVPDVPAPTAGVPGLRPGFDPRVAEEAIATLTSRVVTKAFIADEGLLPALFSDRWDTGRRAWHTRFLDKAPTISDGYRAFDAIRTVSRDPYTGLVTLSIEWKDPGLAATWANGLVFHANRHMQRRAVESIRARMVALEQEMSHSRDVALRARIASLIADQATLMTMANHPKHYAFRVQDPAVPPPAGAFVKPRSALMVALGLMIGVYLGIFLAFTRDAFSSQGSRSPAG